MHAFFFLIPIFSFIFLLIPTQAASHQPIFNDGKRLTGFCKFGGGWDRELKLDTGRREMPVLLIQKEISIIQINIFLNILKMQ